MQHSREAAVWNSVFERAQDALGVPRGSIKATVLIETLPAVFQMHEILYELRQHSAGESSCLLLLCLSVNDALVES
jgi:malate synthase